MKPTLNNLVARRKAPAPLEKDIQNGILDWLRLRGYFAWRQNSGAFKNAQGHFFRFGIKGAPDILAIHNDGSGRFIAIEVKRPGGRVRPEQQDFLDAVKRHNGIAIVAHSLDEVMHILA